MPLGIVDDTSDRDSGHLPTDPFAGLVGNLKSLQARSMKISAQVFVTPWREPMVELWLIVVESSDSVVVVALMSDTPVLGKMAELVGNLCALCDTPRCRTEAELMRILGKIWCCHCRYRFVASRPR